MSQIRTGDDITATAPLSWNPSTNEMSIEDLSASCIQKLAGTTDALTFDDESRVLQLDHSKFWQKYVFPSATELGAFILTGDGSPVSVLSPAFTVYRVIDPEDGQDVGVRLSVDEDAIPRLEPYGNDTEDEIRLRLNTEDQWSFSVESILPLGDTDTQALGSASKPLSAVSAIQFSSPRFLSDGDPVVGRAISISREWSDEIIDGQTWRPLIHIECEDEGDGEGNFTPQDAIVVSIFNTDETVTHDNGDPVVDRFIVDTNGDVTAGIIRCKGFAVYSDPWSDTPETTYTPVYRPQSSDSASKIADLTGTTDRTTSWSTETVTLIQLARRMKALLATLHSQGIIQTP